MKADVIGLKNYLLTYYSEEELEKKLLSIQEGFKTNNHNETLELLYWAFDYARYYNINPLKLCMAIKIARLKTKNMRATKILAPLIANYDTEKLIKVWKKKSK